MPISQMTNSLEIPKHMKVTSEDLRGQPLCGDNMKVKIPKQWRAASKQFYSSRHVSKSIYLSSHDNLMGYIAIFPSPHFTDQETEAWRE